MHADFAPRHADAPGPRLPGVMQLPNRPRQQPINWQYQAEEFDRFVGDDANRVMYRDPEGHLAFTAFLEGDHYGTTRHELVTFGPIVLGKWLRGDDVTHLLPALEGYFSPRYRIFTNGPGDERCELWYLMYVNALAVHLIRRHAKAQPHWIELWRQSAITLRAMAQTLHYDFNHQGYDFAAGGGWTDRDIYRQPDVLGGYAYLMLMTYLLLGDGAYLDEARHALIRYLGEPQNPWYEVPNGALAAVAAAWFAGHGEPMDVHKALAWLLDPEAALATGAWGGQEVNGLARGWRYSERNSVYSMESLMILPFVLPVLRYMPEYAADIGRYALNVAANARLFFSPYMQGCESRPDLSPAVAYERLLESQGPCSPFATGDFQGHKSVYGGAYALWWGALVRPTVDPYILQINVTATDFLTGYPQPAYLYYNPWQEKRTVRVPLGSNSSDLVELYSQQILAHSVTQAAEIDLPPATAYVVTVRQAGAGTHHPQAGST
jgi:hypothetical protein